MVNNYFEQLAYEQSAVFSSSHWHFRIVIQTSQVGEACEADKRENCVYLHPSDGWTTMVQDILNGLVCTQKVLFSSSKLSSPNFLLQKLINTNHSSSFSFLLLFFFFLILFQLDPQKAIFFDSISSNTASANQKVVFVLLFCFFQVGCLDEITVNMLMFSFFL